MSGDQDRDLQGEQARESSDGEVTTFEIKKRSRTTMEEFRRKKAAGEKFEIKFDKEGVPIGTEEAVNKFASYCGYLARTRVPITINDWRKDVSKETRLELWLDIKKMFNIEDDKAMNNTLKAMGISHRAYRSRIAEEYITNADPNNPKNPCDKHPISQKEWEEFFNKRTGADFVQKSNKAKELRKKWKEPHRMGSTGYRGKKGSWKPTDKIVIPGDSEGAGSTSITIGDLEPRSQRYFMGRTVATKDKDTYTFHSSDSSTIEAFSRLSAMSGEINSGSIPEQEVLNRAVDRPEHPGRIRGYPLWTKKEDVYKRKSRKDAHEGWMAPDQIEELMSRVAAEAAEKTKRDLIHSEEIMNAARQQAFQDVKQWLASSGLQIQAPQQFVTPYQPFVEAEEEMPCDLFSLDHNNQRIKVAEGNIIPSVVGQIVHGVPLTDQQLYVHLLRVGDEFREWQVPGRSDELLGNNIGGRFPWPSFLVDIGHKSLTKKKPAKKKAKAKEAAKNVKESPKVPSAGSFVTRDPLLPKDIIDRLSPSEQAVYRLLMLQPEEEMNFELPNCNPWGTHGGDVKFNVNVEDIVECFKREELSQSIVKFYCWFWMEELSTRQEENEFSKSITVLDPELLAEWKFKHEELGAVNYLTRAFMENPSSYLVLPYNQQFHWVVLVINVEKRTVHFVDSLERKNPKLYIKPFISSVYKRYLVEAGRYSQKSRTGFDWYRIKGPIQRGGTECGYFTMLNMRAILSSWTTVGEFPEGVGLASYLLIHFWFTRLQADKAAIKAMLVNRVGDFGLVLGIFGCFTLFQTVDFSTIFACASVPINNSWIFCNMRFSAITMICILLFIGVVGKSAQIGLHWMLIFHFCLCLFSAFTIQKL
ncbi:NADH-ubiquinone oxidoreductase chain 5 [Rhynchospora pubera]|uniref:NADH-ubiquinone oxidoreductase chain 5 n=1 Tax=Rhynchospora pubera TaxID=906938 RepID=A0AAV8ET66_9POAL|nr:NADH-ubiquinone oxidoreductase chain 5 [Rhynchospora pubera]